MFKLQLYIWALMLILGGIITLKNSSGISKRIGMIYI
jgi:hypothetical protein